MYLPLRPGDWARNRDWQPHPNHMVRMEEEHFPQGCAEQTKTSDVHPLATETPGSQPYSVAIRAKGELFSVSSATRDSQEGLGALLGQRTHWISQGAGSLRH